MTIHAGLWIDHHQAVVVLITEDKEEILRIMCDRDTWPQGAPRKNSYTPNDFVAEDKLERKATIQLNKYYDDVIAHVSEADSILIIGPGEAKCEFQKRIQRHKFTGNMAPLQTVDKMTDPQIAAHVRQHFALSPRKKGKWTPE